MMKATRISRAYIPLKDGGGIYIAIKNSQKYDSNSTGTNKTDLPDTNKTDLPDTNQGCL